MCLSSAWLLAQNFKNSVSKQLASSQAWHQSRQICAAEWQLKVRSLGNDIPKPRDDAKELQVTHLCCSLLTAGGGESQSKCCLSDLKFDERKALAVAA